jgi:hypothetical protein
MIDTEVPRPQVVDGAEEDVGFARFIACPNVNGYTQGENCGQHETGSDASHWNFTVDRLRAALSSP